MIGTRVAVALLRQVSLRRASDIGAWLGTLAYRPFGLRAGVVERQVRAAFPGLDHPDVRRIAQSSYAHLGRISIESAIVPGYSREKVLSLFDDIEGWEVFERAVAAGRGVMIVTGHLGNWELGGSLIGIKGIGMNAVARGMENPLFDTYLTENRLRLGVVVIDQKSVV